MTSIHPLVDNTVLTRLRTAVSRFGNRIVERVPTPEELSSFFEQLQAYSYHPLSSRLFFNGEDGTVFVRHVNGSNIINLCTVAHDYTRVGNEPFRDDWVDARTDHAVSTAVSLLDDLQRHLLLIRPSYFHSAHFSSDDEQNQQQKNQQNHSTYTLRMAYRRATHAEPVMTEARALAWRPMGWTSMKTRIATSTEATTWAICHVVATDARADMPRLRQVHATMRAVFDVLPKRRAVPNGNALALLAARLPPAHDPYGRARYPLLRAAVCDESLLSNGVGGTNNMQREEIVTSRAFVLGQEEIRRPLPMIARIGVSSRSKIDTSALFRMFCSFIFLFAFIAIAVYYSIGNNINRNSLMKWVLWGLVVATAFEIIFMCISLVFTKGKTLLTEVSSARSKSIRYQADLATSNAARLFFDGKWLSFTGQEYHGKVEYNGRRFTVSDLMMAGYETTFSMDGREALVAPGSDGQIVRLAHLDSSGGAVFDVAESECSSLATGVVEGVRGTWMSDVAMGRDTTLEKYPLNTNYV